MRLASPADSADQTVTELFAGFDESEQTEDGYTLVDSADPTVELASFFSNERVTLAVRDASLGSVLSMIAQQHGLNVVAGGPVAGTISVTLNDVPLDQALNAVLRSNGYTWNQHDQILFVTPIAADARLSPVDQGRSVRVFSLNFVAADDVQAVVTGLLSPVGQVFITQVDPQDKQRTHEQLIVEDLPEYLDRVAQYVAQADQAPRQVLIEAHVLQVTLQDDFRHGVNLTRLASISGSDITLQTTGLANDAANPAAFIQFSGSELDGLIELLKTTTDTKTLASPKVLALNGQESRIQIGSQLGFLTTTTTQTSTLQNVDFIDVGVVLTVTPLISDDGRVLMSVKPEVSNGRINPDTGLPEEDTTEVQTTLLLNSGQAMIIGGLIQEEDTEIQSKVPVLGDLWKVGRLFQRNTTIRTRSEIIIAMLPTILPSSAPSIACDICPDLEAISRDEVDLQRVQTPLFYGPLERIDRRGWEPKLQSSETHPRSRR